jgi:hypothetical protein
MTTADERKEKVLEFLTAYSRGSLCVTSSMQLLHESNNGCKPTPQR